MILMGPSDPMVASDPFWVVASELPTIMECHKGFGAQMRFWEGNAMPIAQSTPPFYSATSR